MAKPVFVLLHPSALTIQLSHTEDFLTLKALAPDTEPLEVSVPRTVCWELYAYLGNLLEGEWAWRGE